MATYRRHLIPFLQTACNDDLFSSATFHDFCLFSSIFTSLSTFSSKVISSSSLFLFSTTRLGGIFSSGSSLSSTCFEGIFSSGSFLSFSPPLFLFFLAFRGLTQIVSLSTCNFRILFSSISRTSSTELLNKFTAFPISTTDNGT